MDRATLLSLVIVLGTGNVSAGQMLVPDIAIPSTAIPSPAPSPLPPQDPPGPVRASEVTNPVGSVSGGPATRILTDPLDLKPTIQIRGRIEAEANMAAQSPQSRATLGDLTNGFGFRRVRLGAQGTLNDSTSWVSEVEMAGGSVRLRDVFIGLDAIPGVNQIRIGHFREPYSLEGMTSSNFMTFLERSPQNVISPARNWGVCGYWWPEDERLLFSLGVFRDGTGSNGQSLGDGNNWAYTTRLTGLPVYEPDGADFRLVHVGGAFSQRVPPNGVINFSPRTGSNILTVDDNPGSPFLPVINVPANDYQLYNLQAAGVLGPLSVQGEWSAASVQQTDAGTIFVHGFYLAGSYFLTGEHRGYNRTRGSFDQVDVLRPVIRNRSDPRGGCGAVELTARFAYFDFTSPNLPPDVNGDPGNTRLFELTFGTNWYLNSFTRVMVNYTAGMPEKIGFAPTVAHIFGLRAAIYW